MNNNPHFITQRLASPFQRPSIATHKMTQLSQVTGKHFGGSGCTPWWPAVTWIRPATLISRRHGKAERRTTCSSHPCARPTAPPTGIAGIFMALCTPDRSSKWLVCRAGSAPPARRDRRQCEISSTFGLKAKVFNTFE